MDNQHDQLVIRQVPFISWLFGLAVLAYSVWVYLQRPDWWYYAAIGVAIALLFLLFSSVLTVTADRLARTLTIQHTGLLVHKRREIPVSSISAIQLEATRPTNLSDSRRARNNTTYRIVVVTHEGEVIPFTASADSARASKEAKAQKLRAFLGVGGADSSVSGRLKMVTGLAQTAFQAQQVALSGPAAQEHVTDGVRWQVQTAAAGGTAITRWFSPDFRCPSGFVYLAQKLAGQGSGAGGLLGGFSKMIYQQSLGMYGFSSDDTPSLASADLLASLEAGLDQHFGVFTSDPSTARHILNPRAISPLVIWGNRHPLKQMQKGGFGQLAVLFSPRGTYLACLGTQNQAAVQELSALGVALIKAMA